jgi:hypothetical protein
VTQSSQIGEDTLQETCCLDFKGKTKFIKIKSYFFVLRKKSKEDVGPNKGRTQLIQMCCYPFSDGVEHLNVSAFFMPKVNII